ncbi:sodium:proton antiporter [Pyramidobacter sp. SM-530-WT-4B]|uniref:Sodium:proton antiporter n=1 Tax=Pyramidobacter porci TaxID=2605789 RepID=A0A6L5Y9A5_9BACT|nr:Na+/H+ antiporter NhaC family protein [Pyramidobacter porci]MST54836.1 sodium:proton antiporter [Pyramidobacter porci]
METYGALSLIPIFVLFAMAFSTKRSLEPLFVAAIVGHIIIYKVNFATAWIDSLYKVMCSKHMVWLILVVTLFGSLIALLEKSGGLGSFAALARKFATSRKKSLVITWLLGSIFFLDDYLHNLTTASTMKYITDSHGVKRTELAYVVNSNAGNLCCLMPISSWVVFFAGLLETSGFVVGSATSTYLHCIPYLFYCWIAIIISFLFALGVIPAIGPMKTIDPELLNSEDEPAAENGRHNVWNFLLPVVTLVGVTVLCDNEILYGVMAALVVCAVTFLVTKTMSYDEFFKVFMQGMKNMVFIDVLLIVAFTLKEANDTLKLAPYIIGVVKPIMKGGLLPAVTFVVCIIYAYFTSCFWSMAAVMLPIVIPLAQGIGVNVYLVLGAVFSAAAFGSQSCLFSDALIMCSAATNISTADHGVTTLPYALLGAGVSFVLFLIGGFVL